MDYIDINTFEYDMNDEEADLDAKIWNTMVKKRLERMNVGVSQSTIDQSEEMTGSTVDSRKSAFKVTGRDMSSSLMKQSARETKTANKLGLSAKESAINE